MNALGVAIGDLNKDGKADVVAVGKQALSEIGGVYEVFTFLGDGTGKWTPVAAAGLPQTGRERTSRSGWPTSTTTACSTSPSPSATWCRPSGAPAPKTQPAAQEGESEIARAGADHELAQARRVASAASRRAGEARGRTATPPAPHLAYR
ncbi:MAG: VCBS repeat-containing protein [Candidatus Binatia bacterium]